MMDDLLGEPPSLDAATAGVVEIYWLLRRGRSSETGLNFTLQEVMTYDPTFIERLQWMDEEYLTFVGEKREEKLRDIRSKKK